jgi:L-aspartate oxidase
LTPIKTDYLVIGSGIAGLSFALKVSEWGNVIIVTKKRDSESNTNYAQGGIAAVTAPDDDISLHLEDTLTAGAGLCHQRAVEVLVKEGPRRIKDLVEWGVAFTRRNEAYDLGREGGHSRNRILHAADMTGAEIERALLNAVRQKEQIQIYEDHFAIDLLTEKQALNNVNRLFNTCFGAYILNEKSGDVFPVQAKVTLLATGGAARVYRHSTNPAISTGDGIAMANRAKAKIANMEFIQFHPTALFDPEGAPFLISEALRGFGGILRRRDGYRFMPDYDSRAELAPRDIVARTIDSEMKKTGDNNVLLDMTALDAEAVKNRFPGIYNYCLTNLRIDISREAIPVVPAAHYVCGGIMTDLYGQSSIANLFAVGECAHSGVHGANRLASNSLLEAVVFSHRAALASKKYLTEDCSVTIPQWDDSGVVNDAEWLLLKHNLEELQMVMWDYVGIVRSRQHLLRAKRRVELLFQEIEDYYRRTVVTAPILELRNLTEVATLIIRSALKRQESRGLHFMSDFPDTDARFLKDTIL